MDRVLTPADLEAVSLPADPSIAPDGRAVVFVRRVIDVEEDRDDRSLWWIDVPETPAREPLQPRGITTGPQDSAPRWSPDGRAIAFLRPVDGTAQLHLLDTAGPGEPRVLTTLTHGAGPALWSPDGTRIAMLARTWVPAADGGADPDDSAAPIVIDRLGYKLDGTGMFSRWRSHAKVIDVATGTVTEVTAGGHQVSSLAWHPDGSHLVGIVDDVERGDITGETTAFVVRADGSELAPFGPTGHLGGIVWPAGMAGPLLIGRADTTTGNTHLLAVPDPVRTGGSAVPAGSAVRVVAEGLDRSVMPGGPGYPGGLPQSAGDAVLFCARDAGRTHLYTTPFDDLGSARKFYGADDLVIAGVSVTAPGAARPLAAVIAASPTSYGELVVIDAISGEVLATTAWTAQSLPDVELIAPTERTFTISDGMHVHGFVLRDPSASGPGPLLVDVHGGPHNAWSGVPDIGHAYQQALLSQGWTILMLNVRGSDGYGDHHFACNVGAWGAGDEVDFLEPMRQLVSEGIADPRRLALTGYSYGGYMTCWLTGHTDEFAAAVAGGAVTDIVTQIGADIGHHFLTGEMAGTPWDDVDRLTAQSPFPSVGQVSTPTLMLHGEKDDRCPILQAESWFTSLRSRGIPTEMVVYPGASHLFILEGKPSHRRDYSTRVTEWVTRHTSTEGIS
ncbi:MAG: prolyl oligopeptidase family serine peptidase [Nakamurella sp.]